MFKGVNARTFEQQITQVQTTPLKIRYDSAIICYIFLIGALYYFILREHRTSNEAFLLGIFIYGVYETTTYATLQKWKIETVIKDTLWGGILFYLTTYLTYKIQEKTSKS
jgi:uncharacterized membrane protein